MDGHSATGPQLGYIDSFVYFTRFSSEPLGCFRFCSCIKLVTSTVKNFCSRYKLVCPSIYMLAKHCILAVAFTNQRTMPPVHSFYISNKISFLFSDLYLADSHIYLFLSYVSDSYRYRYSRSYDKTDFIRCSNFFEG